MSCRDIKPGDVVEVNAPWAPIRGGAVSEVESTGFKIERWWFGWHELVDAPIVVTVKNQIVGPDQCPGLRTPGRT